MPRAQFERQENREPATRCKKHGICTKRCISPCQTGEIMEPEDMVKYGWSLEAARRNQASEKGDS